MVWHLMMIRYDDLHSKLMRKVDLADRRYSVITGDNAVYSCILSLLYQSVIKPVTVRDPVRIAWSAFPFALCKPLVRI